jgi:hypothetical protein
VRKRAVCARNSSPLIVVWNIPRAQIRNQPLDNHDRDESGSATRLAPIALPPMPGVVDRGVRRHDDEPTLFADAGIASIAFPAMAGIAIDAFAGCSMSLRVDWNMGMAVKSLCCSTSRAILPGEAKGR